jgi:hypothetical protein
LLGPLARHTARTGKRARAGEEGRARTPRRRNDAYPSPKELIYGGLLTLEARAERMYGSTSWNHATYIGPQLSFNLMWKLSVGWMINVHDSSDQHPQLGLGFGY